MEKRLDCIEKNVSKLEEKLDLVLENHLPHLLQTLESVQTRVEGLIYLAKLITSAVVLAIVGAILKLVIT